MRHIPDDLAARIESGAARLCHVWLMRRVDGTRAGFTDHDRDLTLDGVVCRAANGWTVGAAESGVGLAAGTASASGVLDDASIREADVAQGRLDGAAVELWRLDWSEPGLRVRLWSGTITRLRWQDGAFVADLEGPLAKLERVVGRTYGRLCDARLGDARCGVADAAGRTCDKRWETCVGTFGNGVNFRGFPDVPGDDFLTAWPAQGGRHDGGSRR
ncbi:hypothetical protein DSM05_11130 [Pseudomonas sp. FW305-3-2-15-E-TSA4]|nr:hypothetical protein [Pseudomonas sp. FW305-3-2-15-E-TSA4]